jgi:hypothetical protein
MALFALIALHSIVFRRSVYAEPAPDDMAPPRPAFARLAAVLSLTLWIAVLCAGRAIGYVEGRPGMHFK